MLLIPCPHCGPREESEFAFAGELPRERPAGDVADAGWNAYLFNRAALRGPQQEAWHHVAGCGRFFVVVRDTASHAILASHASQDKLP